MFIILYKNKFKWYIFLNKKNNLYLIKMSLNNIKIKKYLYFKN